MSIFEPFGPIAPMAAGALLSGLWQWRQTRHRKFAAELQRIEWATEKMREHGQAVDRFMYLPCAPEKLKAFLLDACDVLDSRDFARLIAAKLKDGFKSNSEGDSQDTEIWTDLQTLGADNSEAYDIFLQALFSGIMAALLRWPETAPVLSMPVAPTRDNIKRELAVTAQAVRENTPHEWRTALVLA